MPSALPPSAPLLEARSLDTYYGQRQALYGLSLRISKGETIGLMGRNGMGKTTLVRTLVGLLRPRRGQVLLDGEDITALPTYAIAQRGVAYVPEGRGIFANLSVAENLSIAEAGSAPGDWTLPRVLELFPRLAERLTHRGDQLSGGEQQMLAIGRALMMNPRLLLLDEATEGLAPLLREEIWRTIRLIRATGMTTLLIDKTVAAVTAIADRTLILVKGEIVFEGTPHELKARPELMHRHLGV
ncbi:MAG TPA: ABC transporter ATP-binding protein [Hyphomicrobiaceae bacterium]|jgi:branched-chain amino acid transport system ATP-binding protein|nr:ABC transporter ATP-binding protein [Hyphomicrobiaceae bacterium]